MKAGERSTGIIQREYPVGTGTASEFVTSNELRLTSMKPNSLLTACQLSRKRGSFLKLSLCKKIPIILIVFLSLSLPAILPHSLIAAEEVKEVALDFDDVDIRLFIRVISELAGKNFIIDNIVIINHWPYFNFSK